MLDLLLVGHLSKDRIVAGDSVTCSTGGAVFYGALPASLFELAVGVLTKCAAEDEPLLEPLRAAGIEVHVRPSARTTAIQNIAKTADFERRRFVVDAVADPFTAEDLAGVAARVISVCPLMRGEFPPALLVELARRAEVAADAQGFIRVRDGEGLRSADWPDKREALAAVTYLKTDRREAEILTGIDDAEQAARALCAMGPREVLVTQSAGLLVCDQGRCLTAAFDAQQVAGRTGRGDTALASYLAKRRSAPPEEALRWAAALVSRKLERPGPFAGPLALVERSLRRGDAG
jgi:sugar/nucleoside kinase (ribokinase family)